MQVNQSFYLTLSEAIQQWMASKALKASTQRAYATETKRYIDWACVEKKVRSYSELERLNSAEFLEFVAVQHLFGRMASERYRLSANSLDQTRRIVLAFLRWLAMLGKAKAGEAWFIEREFTRTLAQNLAGANPEITDSVVRIPRDVLTTTKDCKGLVSARNALMANLAFWCCATTSEIANLKTSSLQHTTNVIEINFKGKNDRTVELPMHLHKLMNSYLILRSQVHAAVPREDDHLFIGQDTRARLNHWTVRRGVRSVCPSKETETLVTPQSLRRAFQNITEPLPLSAGNVAYRLGKKAVVSRNAGVDMSAQSVKKVVAHLASSI